MPESRPYSRVYHEIETHDLMREVFESDRFLALWLRLLLLSDRYYPQSAPIPRQTKGLSRLVALGIVEVESPNRYRMRGQIAERERRSHAARNAAASRWGNAGAQSERIARREEKRREEKGAGNAGASSFMGFRPRGESFGKSEHYGQHPACVVCEPLRREAERERRKGGGS